MLLTVLLKLCTEGKPFNFCSNFDSGTEVQANMQQLMRKRAAIPVQKRQERRTLQLRDSTIGNVSFRQMLCEFDLMILHILH